MLPEYIRNEEELDELLTRPRPVLVDFMRTLRGPLLILGAGGKMGPSLAVLARRAAQAAGNPLEIIAVSRFSDGQSRAYLEANGISTIGADLMNREQYAGLPDTENLLYLVGLKFGTSQDPARTWATNTLIPACVAERYAKARIVALSSGNVYPLAPVNIGGSREDDSLTPLGEYANACVARERILEFFSRANETPLTILRLSYALDLRYGVLVDIALKIFRGEPVDIGMAYTNCIWQGDANEMIIRALSLASAPPTVLNLVGSRRFSVRQVASRFGELLGKPVFLTGEESPTALLSNNERLRASLGEPPTPVEAVMKWTAGWVAAGGRLLNRPTHFETRDGVY